MATTNPELKSWIDQVTKLTRPKQIHWCNGSDDEYANLAKTMTEDGTFIPLNQKTHAHSYLHRSDPTDVARVEHLTFICCRSKEDAGPNNHWMDPGEAHAKMDKLFDGCMEGRTMYVVPYCMGPIDSPLSRCGVEITDSPYVVCNMKIMTRMGDQALARIEKDGSFVKGLHSTGELDPERRFIMHFPEEGVIKSFGSGYGGNALLGKKCHALRMASWQARNEGWLAEHMLILGIENPQGETKYVAAAFPSACGKTNLAMLIPPEKYQKQGYKVWTVGDDIAWMRIGDDGRLYAINPEAGYFGVAPGTSEKTNPNALSMLKEDCIFTNVGLTAEGEPWWEGLTEEPPASGMTDWKGNLYNPSKGPAAHPNSRFTVSAKKCPTYSPRSEDAGGVPISAIIFGGRRKSLAPLVFQSKSWDHGVLVGASVASETTAAATGAVGVVRRDPMAMKPFCGYNFADYWSHWVSLGSKSDKLPKIFHVNWFRQDANGKFLWPGFGENLRVLNWILDRCEGRGEARETPIGYLPTATAIDTDGIQVKPEELEALTTIEASEWQKEFKNLGEYFAKFGARMPKSLLKIREDISTMLSG